MHKHGDRTAWLQGGTAVCRDPGALPRRPWHLVLLGAPGVGKGTQAELIVARFGACHLSTGDVFRAAAAGCGGENSPAMQTALAAMRRGELVTDATVVALVRERVGCLVCRHGFLLDGFPRTVEQARVFDGILRGLDVQLDAVVNLFAPESAITNRLAGRRVCRTCKASWHVEYKRPRREGVCEACGGELLLRDDDRPETIHTRLAAYQATSRPVVEHYRAAGTLVEIDASGSPAEVFAHVERLLRGILESPRSSAASPSPGPATAPAD